MTNAPFRVAFWTMCLAMVLSFIVLASSPDAGRLFALTGERGLAQRPAPISMPAVVLGPDEKLTFPIQLEETGDSVKEVPDPYPELAASDPVRPGDDQPVQWPTEYSPPPTTGIRTASANPNIVLGMIEQQQQPVPAGPTSPAVEAVTTPAIEIVTASEAGAAQISVPTPELPTSPSESMKTFLDRSVFPEPEFNRLHSSVTHLKVAQLERELAEVRLEERGKLQQLAEGELTAIRNRIQQFRNLSSEPLPAQETGSTALLTLAMNDDLSLPAEAGSQTAHGESNPSESQETPGAYKISESSEAGRFDISVKDVAVTEILMELGKRLNWRVVIAPEVTGRFTGEFEAADIEQAFVMIIKAHQLGVDRRGDYILIRTR